MQKNLIVYIIPFMFCMILVQAPIKTSSEQPRQVTSKASALYAWLINKFTGSKGTAIMQPVISSNVLQPQAKAVSSSPVSKPQSVSYIQQITRWFGSFFKGPFEDRLNELITLENQLIETLRNSFNKRNPVILALTPKQINDYTKIKKLKDDINKEASTIKGYDVISSFNKKEADLYEQADALFRGRKDSVEYWKNQFERRPQIAIEEFSKKLATINEKLVAKLKGYRSTITDDFFKEINEQIALANTEKDRLLKDLGAAIATDQINTINSTLNSIRQNFNNLTKVLEGHFKDQLTQLISLERALYTKLNNKELIDRAEITKQVDSYKNMTNKIVSESHYLDLFNNTEKNLYEIHTKLLKDIEDFISTKL